MPRSAATAERAFDALGDPTRRRVFRLLQGGERSVGDIAAELPVSRPAVSQHLRVLKEAALVTDRPDGVRRLYSVQRTGLEALRAERALVGELHPRLPQTHLRSRDLRQERRRDPARVAQAE